MKRGSSKLPIYFLSLALVLTSCSSSNSNQIEQTNDSAPTVSDACNRINSFWNSYLAQGGFSQGRVDSLREAARIFRELSAGGADFARYAEKSNIVALNYSLEKTINYSNTDVVDALNSLIGFCR